MNKAISSFKRSRYGNSRSAEPAMITLTPPIVLMIFLLAVSLNHAHASFSVIEGIGMVEAEDFDARTQGPALCLDPVIGNQWLIVPNEEPPDVYAIRDASNRAFIASLPDCEINNRPDPFAQGPTVAYDFTVDEAGDYEIWVRVASKDSASDSFYLSVDGGAKGVAGDWWRFNPKRTDAIFHYQVEGGAGQQTGANPFNLEIMSETLSPGFHTLVIAMREDGSAIDELVVAKRGKFPPPTCYTTSLKLETPMLNPDGIDTVVFEWSTIVLSDSVATSDLVDLSMTLLSDDAIVYTDTVLVGGVLQPIGGAARTPMDLFWDFDLDTLTLRQMRNVGFGTIMSTTGVQYLVTDSLSLPDDSKVVIVRRTDGVFDFSNADLLKRQRTRVVKCQEEDD